MRGNKGESRRTSVTSLPGKFAVGKHRGKSSTPTATTAMTSVPVQVNASDAVNNAADEMSEFTETETHDDLMMEMGLSSHSAHSEGRTRHRLQKSPNRLSLKRNNESSPARQIMMSPFAIIPSSNLDDSQGSSESDSSSRLFSKSSSATLSKKGTVKSIAQQFESQSNNRNEEFTAVHHLPTSLQGRRTSLVLKSTIEAFDNPRQPIKHTDKFHQYKQDAAQTCLGLVNRKMVFLEGLRVQEQLLTTTSRHSSKQKRKSETSSVRALPLVDWTETESLTSWKNEEDDENSFLSSNSSTERDNDNVPTNGHGLHSDIIDREGLINTKSTGKGDEEEQIDNETLEEDQPQHRQERRRVSALRPGTERGSSFDGNSEVAATMQAAAATISGEDDKQAASRRTSGISALRPGTERGSSFDGDSETQAAVPSNDNIISVCSTPSNRSDDSEVGATRQEADVTRPGIERGSSFDNDSKTQAAALGNDFPIKEIAFKNRHRKGSKHLNSSNHSIEMCMDEIACLESPIYHER